MKSFKRLLAVAAGPLLVVAAAVAAPVSSSAVPPCHAYGSLPSRLSVNQSDEIIYSYLRATGGCSGPGYDMSGASAYFDGPDGITDFVFWDRFNEKSRIDLYSFEATPGTYRAEDGEVNLYDADYNPIPTDWSNRSMVVKFQGRFADFAAQRSGTTVTLTSKIERYDVDEYGFTPFSYKRVSVQRQHPGGSHWATFAGAQADRAGQIRFTYNTSAKWVYRLYYAATSSVWGDITDHTKYV